MIYTEIKSSIGINRASLAALLALGLGVAADQLVLRQGLTGAGFLSWMVLWLTTVQLLSRSEVQPRWRYCWSVFALTAAFLLFYRSTPVLVPMMLLVLLSCGVNWLLQHRASKHRAIAVLDYPWTTLRLPLLFLLLLWHTAGHIDPALVPRSRVRGVIKGLLMAAPILLVFALLFASADARFDGYLSSVSQMFSLTAVEHLITMTLMSVLAFGLLAMVLHKPDPGRLEVPETLSLGREETLIIMGSLLMLFLVFVVLQAGYLFGGQDVIEQTGGLTLADYARRGFFEMLAVAGLTLMLLLGMSGLRCDTRFFRPLAIAMVALVLIIMISALQRLLLYVEAFGLTMDRLLALGVMLWLAGSLVGFVLTVLRGRPQGFAFGSVVFGMTLLLIAGFMNPAAIVARTNIERVVADADRSIDVHYLVGLGDDAIPVILARFAELPTPVQCRFGAAAQLGWLNRSKQTDWREWNWSRATTLRAVEQNSEKLETIFQQALEDMTARVASQTIRGIFKVC
ncbi:MAG: hypothetical protein CMQ34_14470 [Gammaproteobacteria bacterium]|nr:hypothetical protein [Gammaproteobacteria bacterium]|tara:strand:+ start:946 stop:2481 length:1536 start_codon:yes stop_codon:yes gene_type:complete